VAEGRFGPFTGNQLTIILLAAIVAAGFPTTLFAVAAFTNSVLIDAGTGQRARVIGGALKVGDGVGPLTVDGTVSARPARPDAMFSTFGLTTGACSTVYQPPAGSAAVVTEANFTVEAFIGTGIVAPRIFIGPPGSCILGQKIAAIASGNGLQRAGFGPGLTIPAGQALNIDLYTKDASATAVTYIYGYTVPQSAVPAPTAAKVAASEDTLAPSQRPLRR